MGHFLLFESHSKLATDHPLPLGTVETGGRKRYDRDVELFSGFGTGNVNKRITFSLDIYI